MDDTNTQIIDTIVVDGVLLEVHAGTAGVIIMATGPNAAAYMVKSMPDGIPETDIARFMDAFPQKAELAVAGWAVNPDGTPDASQIAFSDLESALAVLTYDSVRNHFTQALH